MRVENPPALFSYRDLSVYALKLIKKFIWTFLVQFQICLENTTIDNCFIFFIFSNFVKYLRIVASLKKEILALVYLEKKNVIKSSYSGIIKFPLFFKVFI